MGVSKCPRATHAASHRRVLALCGERKFLLESKLQFMANIVLARAANYEIIFRLAGPPWAPAHLSTKLENFQPQVWWPAPLTQKHVCWQLGGSQKVPESPD